MPTGEQRARYERQLSSASAALWRARDAAERFNDPGAVEDLEAIRMAVITLMEDSLKNKKRQSRVMPGQLSLG